MDAIAIMGCSLAIFSLVLSIYNTILVKAELLSRYRRDEQPTDTLDKARVLYSDRPIELKDELDDANSPWNREPQDDMEELLR